MATKAELAARVEALEKRLRSLGRKLLRAEREAAAARGELAEAREQQTGTAEILRAISRSPADIAPVLEAVVQAAARFCGAPDVVLARIDGEILRCAAGAGPFAQEMARRAGGFDQVTMPVNRGSVAGRAVVEGRALHIRDLAAEPEDEYPVGRELQRRFGHRTMAAAPLLREGGPVGALVLFRSEVRPFSDHQIALLQTFADQAVIAIENVRLFAKLQERNRALSEALAREEATGATLSIVSRSQADPQPVFDAIARHAVTLCGGLDGFVIRYDGELMHLGSHHNLVPERVHYMERRFPQLPDRSSTAGIAILDRTTAHVADLQGSPQFAGTSAYQAGRGGLIAVPLLRDGQAIGAIGEIGRAHV